MAACSGATILRMGLGVIVHGGAGAVHQDDRGAELAEACMTAAQAAFQVLQRGGSAVDACVAAAVLLEDDPRFNAGTGSVLNEDGEVETDASVMDGSLRAGAVALVKTVKNPVLLARAVMERSSHVLLAGEGAEKFAKEVGLPMIDNISLITDRARERWKEGKATSHGTIGVAAVDKDGRVAAATSTGGMSNKRRGRIGDSPLIGCGTYADDEAGAASATGHGEALIRVTLTRKVIDFIQSGCSPTEACQRAIATLARVRGEGGVIAVSRRGEVGFAFNTQRMNRAFVTDLEQGAGFN